MSETLFELTGEFLEVMDMFTDPDIDPQVLADTLESIEGAIEVKAEGYVKVLKALEAEAKTCKEQEEEWKAKRQVRENHAKRMKEALKHAMIATGKEEIAAGEAVKIKLVNNGGQLPLIVDPEAKIPDRFQKITYSVDNGLIRQALDDGEALPFAHYGERGKSIKIK